MCTYFNVYLPVQVGRNLAQSSPLVTASAHNGQDRSLFSRSIDGSQINLPNNDDIKSGPLEEDAELAETSTASFESFISKQIFL